LMITLFIYQFINEGCCLLLYVSFLMWYFYDKKRDEKYNGIKK
jgi:hypothetical protein